MPVEGPAKCLRGTEAAAPRDGVNRVVGAGERALRSLDPDALDVGRGRGADLGGEPALQVPRAQASLAGQVADAVRGSTPLPCCAPGDGVNDTYPTFHAIA